MIAVHCGAGQYSKDPKKIRRFLMLTKRACKKGSEVLEAGGTAAEAVTESIRILEDDSITNAGLGSNLTLDGKVECEASLMNGSNLLFGACGAVSQVKNPICLAYEIYRGQLKPMPLGLAPVSLLAGNGAYHYAKKAGLMIVKNSKLVSRKALKHFQQYKMLLEEARVNEREKIVEQELSPEDVNLEYMEDDEFSTQSFELKVVDNDSHTVMDTVGAVCLDSYGHVAAGCSSGGVLLKRPGRMAQAAHYGSGCWADSSDRGTNPSIAVCTTGSGEQLVKTILAKTIADDLINDSSTPGVDLHTCMTKKFLESKYLQNETLAKLAGAVILKANYKTGEVSLMWTHNTADMAIGYMKQGGKVHCSVSTLPEGSTEGKSINVGGTSFHFPNLTELDS